MNDEERRAQRRNLELALWMRHNPTPAENTMWQRLRRHKLGCKFRRQELIGYYIVDFCCAACRLIIEIDGETHLDPEQISADEERTSYLEAHGNRVLRYTNNEVRYQINDVLEAIVGECGKKRSDEH